MTSPQPTPTPEPTPAPASTTPTPEPKPETPTITVEMQKLIDAAAAAARKDGEKSGKAAAEAAIEAARKAAEDDAERTRQIAAGEFDAVKTSLETERDGLKTERDDYKTRYESAIAQIAPGVEARWKDVPAEVTALYTGAEDDPVARMIFLDKSGDLIRALTATSGETPRVPLTPTPNGPPGQLTTEQEAERAARSRRIG